MTTEEVINRLHIYSKRLRDSVSQALLLNSTFQALNESEEWRKAIAGSRIASAANIFQHAALRELILIIVRVFDRPRGPLATSDKVSFPVISLWLDDKLVREELVSRARNWFPDGHGADENEAAARGAIKRLEENLDRLANESPNREKLLRQFRDEFLAHELHFDVPRDKPLFEHIYSMLDEIKSLSESASLVVEGSNVAWNFLADEARESADELWKAVAAAYRSDGAGGGINAI